MHLFVASSITRFEKLIGGVFIAYIGLNTVQEPCIGVFLIREVVE